MKQPLSLYVVQTDLIWENINQNLLRFQWHIARTEPGSIVLLPEMFATGFTMNPAEFAQPMSGLALTWMKDVSSNRCICGSLAIEENGQYFNRFVAVADGIVIAQYDKRYLFSLGSESEFYTAGTESIRFEWQGWTFAPFICYDLRFPEWIRKQAGVDVMLFSAHWPKSRISAWNALLKARAIENQCFIAASNRVGNDVWGFPHSGCSQIIDYIGSHLVGPIENKEVLIHQILEASPMHRFREKYPFLDDISFS
jgi:predicted amidohydrolase